MRNEVAFLDSLQGRGIRPGLRRMQRLLARLGHPERCYRSIIVAGTNGKGSTAATLAAILQQSGYRTGLYTSPHLITLMERWMINGEPLPPRLFRSAVHQLQRVVSDTSITPTYFEALTLMGFIAFRDSDCDAVVLEVGMGGRLDATNVVDPVVSVIASVSLDHTDYLGSTIEAIASEKAGVIHRAAPVVTSDHAPSIVRSFRDRARDVGTPLHLTSRECESDEIELDLRRTRFLLRSPMAVYELQSPLAGGHQIENVTLAVRAAELAAASLPRISASAIESGVRKTRWRGRLESFTWEKKRVIVDGAHNPGAAARIARFVENQTRAPRTLVFAAMEDKDVAKVAEELFPLFEKVILTIADEKRGMRVESLSEIARSHAVAFEFHGKASNAFRAALRQPARVVVITGSLYLAGSALAFFDRMRSRTTKKRGPQRVSKEKAIAR